VNLVAAVVAYEQPLEVVQRGEGALDHPPVRGLAISGSVWIRWSSASRYHGRYSRSFVAEIYEYQRAAWRLRIVCRWFTLSGSWMFRSSPPAESIAPSHDVPDRCMPVTRIGSPAAAGRSCRMELNGSRSKLRTRECARHATRADQRTGRRPWPRGVAGFVVMPGVFESGAGCHGCQGQLKMHPLAPVEDAPPFSLWVCEPA
jgi:hypothetical protein